MRWAILDTSIYVGQWEAGCYDDLLENLRRAFIVRHSAVVLSELRRGARSRAARSNVERLHSAAHVVWEPTADDWWKAGKLVREVGDQMDWEVHKRREFQNDALIALTARARGATIITSNREDFDLLKSSLGLSLICT